MPRKVPLPQLEIDIGKRLRQFREERLISQTDLAGALLITRSQLINYETGVSPLPWHVAVNLLRKFSLNPRWLATGKLPKRLNPDAKLNLEPPNYSLRARSFSKAYHDLWAKDIAVQTIKMEAFAVLDKTREDDIREAFTVDAARGWIRRIPEGREGEFLLRLANEAEKIIGEMNPNDQGPPVVE